MIAFQRHGNPAIGWGRFITPHSRILIEFAKKREDALMHHDEVHINAFRITKSREFFLAYHEEGRRERKKIELSRPHT